MLYAKAANWPGFAPARWPTFTPPLTRCLVIRAVHFKQVAETRGAGVLSWLRAVSLTKVPLPMANLYVAHPCAYGPSAWLPYRRTHAPVIVATAHPCAYHVPQMRLWELCLGANYGSDLAGGYLNRCRFFRCFETLGMAVLLGPSDRRGYGLGDIRPRGV